MQLSRRSLGHTRHAVLALVLTGFVSPAFAATLTGLGHLPTNSSESKALGVSADGTTAVGYSLIVAGGSGRHRAFAWTAANGMIDLGDLPDGANYNSATSVSADGSKVVGRANTYSTVYGKGFIWDATNGIAELSDFAGGAAFDSAAGISSDGTKIAGYSHPDGLTQARLRDAPNMTITDLGDLPGGTVFSLATGISADGSAVIGVTDAYFGQHAMVWTATTGMVGIGDLPGGAYGSRANGVSADGSIVVGYAEAAAGQEAFIWDATHLVVSLGELPGGIHGSRAEAVSADGSVVVGGSYTGFGYTAFVWTEADGMESLSTLLDEQGADVFGWQLGSANGISADGQTIVGYGTNPSGQTEAFIATLDIPARVPAAPFPALALLAVALATTGARLLVRIAGTS